MIALVDCNNFYASCERVFRPELDNQPIVVLSNNDGCIIARSAEAKELGIPMGAAAYKWEQNFIDNKIHVFSSNYALYGDLSQRVMNILLRFVPEVEVYSIDEAFLYMDGVEKIKELGDELVSKVKKWVGVPISIGIGPTKTLAKAASRIAKKFSQLNGVYLIDTEEKRLKALKWLKVDDVWGIGRRHAEKMNYFGIKTAFDLTQKTDSFVRKHFTVVGLRTKKELEGERCIEFEHKDPLKKSIATTRSFAEMQSEMAPIVEAICHYTELCAQKLRRKKLAATNLMVFMNTNSFRQLPQYKGGLSAAFQTPTNNTTEMVRLARNMAVKIYRPGFEYKRAGVVVSGLVQEGEVQLSLFDTIDRSRLRELYKTVDFLNDCYGRNTITIASSKGSRKWKLKQEKLSKSYTTRWDDLLEIGD